MSKKRMLPTDIFIDPAFTKYYQQYPIVLVDVGARRGLRGYWECAEKHLKMIGFEPDERSFSELKQSDSKKYLNVGLYKEKTLFDLYLTKKEGCTSILKPNRKFLSKFPTDSDFDILKTTKIKCDTMDNQFREQHIDDVDFCKLDTQGSELFILQGATETLKSVFGLEMEVEFAQIYEGQPLFSDIDSFVRERGFGLFDLRPYYWKRKTGLDYGYAKGQLIFADALYFRTPESISKIINRIDDDFLKKSKILRSLSICILYGYFDYALELFSLTDHLFDNTEAKLILERMKCNALDWTHKIPDFRGKSRIANLFYALWKAFLPRNLSGIKRGKLGAAEVDK